LYQHKQIPSSEISSRVASEYSAKNVESLGTDESEESIAASTHVDSITNVV